MFLINFQTSKVVCRLLLELQVPKSSFPEQGHPLERLHHSCHWHFRRKFLNKSYSLSRQLQTRIDGRSWRHLHWLPGREDWRRQRLCCLSRSGSPPTKALSRCPIDGGRRNIRGSWCRASSSLSFRNGFRKSWRRRGCPSWRPAWWWRDCLLSKCHCKIFCRTTPGKWPETFNKYLLKHCHKETSTSLLVFVFVKLQSKETRTRIINVKFNQVTWLSRFRRWMLSLVGFSRTIWSRSGFATGSAMVTLWQQLALSEQSRVIAVSRIRRVRQVKI